MEELIKMVDNYGVSIIIVVLFLWDWVSNKKIVSETLVAIKETNSNIEGCLERIEQNNANISKMLDLLQRTLEHQDEKIDRILSKLEK